MNHHFLTRFSGFLDAAILKNSASDTGAPPSVNPSSLNSAPILGSVGGGLAFIRLCGFDELVCCRRWFMLLNVLSARRLL